MTGEKFLRDRFRISPNAVDPNASLLQRGNRFDQAPTVPRSRAHTIEHSENLNDRVELRSNVIGNLAFFKDAPVAV